MNKILKKPKYFEKLISAGIYSAMALSTAAMPHLASAKEKEIPQQIEIVIHENDEKKEKPVTVGIMGETPQPAYSINVKRISETAFANAQKNMGSNTDFRFTVNQFKGYPTAVFPISVPPGTNGVKPDLAVMVNQQSAYYSFENGISLDGAQTIHKCDTGVGLCLSNQPLMAVKGAAEGSQFTLAGNPRMRVSRTELGYTLSYGDGTEHKYKSLNSDQSSHGPWKISESTDWYGNFIAYFYSPKSGFLTDIFYGQKDAKLENLRSVHILYDEKAGSLPVQVSTMLGSRDIRSYIINTGSNGMVSSLTECATDDAEKLHCRPSASFSWSKDSKSKTMLLSSTANGYGGVTDVEYADMPNGPVVSKLVVSERNNPMETTAYQYSNPIIKNDQRVGFENSTAMDKVTGIGEFTTYGTGELAGVIMKTGMFISDATEPQLETSYNYERINNDPERGYILSNIVSKKTDDNQKLIDSTAEKRFYDEAARLKSVHTDANTTSISYLNEEKPETEGDAKNLVTKTTVINNNTKQSQTKTITYGLQNGAPQKSTRKTFINGKENTDLKVEQVADQYGNMQSYRTKNGGGRIKYDDNYKSFPEKLTTSLKTETYDTAFSYDPLSGVETSSATPIGDISTKKLDPFGEIIEKNSVIKNPMDKGIGSNFSAIIKETKEWSTNSQGARVETKTRTFSNSLNGDLLQYTIKTHYDGLNRVTRVDNAKKNLKTNEQIKSSMATEYHANGQTIKVTDETGKIQETYLDAEGKPVKEIAPGYGTHEFTYDDVGNLATVTRNGQTVKHKYDSQGRLIQKILPDNKVYEFEYDKLLPKKLSSAVLPGGQRIEYTFTPIGQTASKTVYIPGPENKTYKFITSFTYENTRLKTVTYPDGSVVAYDYEGKWKPKAIRWSQNPPQSWKDINTPIVKYNGGEAMDGDHLFLKSLANGIVETYSWQPDGKLNEISVSRPNSKKSSKTNPIVNFQYSHDPDTELLKSVRRADTARNGTDQFSRIFQYDTADNLTSVKETLNGDKKEHRYAYDENNRLISDNDLNNRYNFNEKNSYSLASDSSGTTFQHDANMNISAIAHKNETSTYKFDVENKLLSAVVTSRGKQTNTSFVYDHLGERLIKNVKHGAVTTYISPFFEFTLLPDGSVQQTRYVWDAIGRISAFTETVPENAFLDAIPVVPGKAAGNGEENGGQSGIPERATALDQSVTSISKAFPQLIKDLGPLAAIFIGSLLTLLLFETLYRRWFVRLGEDFATDLPDQSFHSSLCGSSLARAMSALVIVSFLGSILAPSVHASLQSGDGTPKANQTTYFHYDVRGSVVAVTDESGNQTASVNYRPYGGIDDSILSTGNNNFRYKFAGMEYDESTGLYYDHARYLHPGIKRFLSTDISRSTADPYSYTDGDPVNYVDPDGRMKEKSLTSDVEVGLKDVVVSLDKKNTVSNEDSSVEIVQNSQGNNANSINNNQSKIASPSSIQEPLPFQSANPEWVKAPGAFTWFWNVKKGMEAPEPTSDNIEKATQAEKKQFNKDSESQKGYIQGWTRTGGYVQSLFTSFLLAYWFPTADTYTALGHSMGGGLPPVTVPKAGFWIDASVYLMTVTAFSGFGKAYTANAAYYWQGVTSQKAAGWKDYAWLGVRRVVHKTIGQLFMFSGIALLGRYLRGYTVFDPDLVLEEELLWLAMRNMAFATMGSFVMLAYYLPTKAPSLTYDANLARNNYDNSDWQSIENSWFLKRWTLKASHMYRMFNNRKGYWDKRRDDGKLSRAKSWGWYAIYVVQMYAWYFWGSIGYYAGFATILSWHPQVSTADYFSSWRSNLSQIILSPAASPLAWLVNGWTRKSFTIVRKRSVKRPRTPKGNCCEWLTFKLLGPIEGLRLARYNDAAYLPKEDWLVDLRTQNSSNIHDDSGNDAGNAPSNPQEKKPLKEETNEDLDSGVLPDDTQSKEQAKDAENNN